MKTNFLWAVMPALLLSVFCILGLRNLSVSLAGDSLQPFCLNPEPEVLSGPEALAKQHEKGALHLRIYLHVVRDSSGRGGVSMAGVARSLLILQSDFAPFDIYFHPVGSVHFIDDQPLFEDPNGTGAILQQEPHEDGIDVYLFPDHPGHAVAGGGMVLTIPCTAFFIAGHTVEDPKLPYRLTSVISHEMGHCLGLLHTHHGVEQGGCEELVNRDNCNLCGDYVCDTPSDPGLFLQVAPEHCTWSGQATDSKGQPMQPDLHNIMSYTHPRCMLHFSSGQGARMRQHILQHPLLRKCLLPGQPRPALPK